MFTVETVQTENRVISSILHTLEDEGFVTITNEETEMGETTIHNRLLRYLTDCLELFFAERERIFVAANLNLYYDSNNPRKWYAPDVMVAFDVENRERSSYQLSDERVVPQVIIEVASEQTYDNDLGKKYAEYARLGVEEYYLIDPERAFLPTPLMAYQRTNGELLPITIKDRRIISPRLGLEVVDTGEDFRLFNPATGKFLSSAQELAREKAELEARVAELEALLKQK